MTFGAQSLPATEAAAIDRLSASTSELPANAEVLKNSRRFMPKLEYIRGAGP
jgi:hypothetical protein